MLVNITKNQSLANIPTFNLQPKVVTRESKGKKDHSSEIFLSFHIWTKARKIAPKVPRTGTFFTGQAFRDWRQPQIWGGGFWYRLEWRSKSKGNVNIERRSCIKPMYKNENLIGGDDFWKWSDIITWPTAARPPLGVGFHMLLHTCVSVL